jgi:hypothetical protein
MEGNYGRHQLLHEEHDRLRSQSPPDLEEHAMHRDKLRQHIERIRAYAERLYAEHAQAQPNP